MKKQELKEFARKYSFRCDWSAEDEIYIGRCLELPSVVAHGDTRATAMAESQVAVEAALEWMNEEGEEIPEPFGSKKFSGQIPLRMPEHVHRELAMNAAQEGVSINQYVLSKIAR